MFDRITKDPRLMAGRACIRSMRITVAHLVSLVANGQTTGQILGDYPDLEAEDIQQALEHAATLARDEVQRLAD